jgi:hypothetical protein
MIAATSLIQFSRYTTFRRLAEKEPQEYEIRKQEASKFNGDSEPEPKPRNSEGSF